MATTTSPRELVLMIADLSDGQHDVLVELELAAKTERHPDMERLLGTYLAYETRLEDLRRHLGEARMAEG